MSLRDPTRTSFLLLYTENLISRLIYDDQLADKFVRRLMINLINSD